MEISDFKIMKAYRRSGRLSFLLKLSLPKCTEGHAPFNEFYLKCAQAYTELCASLSESGKDERGVEMMSVSFAAEQREELILVERKMSYKTRSRECLRCETDFYSTVQDVFVKAPKNMRKQRNIPSRNSKKYNKTD